MNVFEPPTVTDANGLFPIDQEMAELSLLLPRAQAVGLIEAARQQGITVAQFMRRLVGRALAELPLPRASLNG